MYDLDDLIEHYEAKTIAEIFSEDGEEYFRKCESEVLRGFGGKKNFVVATGGGTPCFYDNMEWMNINGITIWIDQPVDELMIRLQPEKAHRPLIKNLNDAELRSFLTNKLAERCPYYCMAQYHLKGENISQDSFAEIIKQHA